jgi:hypothetical protein
MPAAPVIVIFVPPAPVMPAAPVIVILVPPAPVMPAAPVIVILVSPAPVMPAAPVIVILVPPAPVMPADFVPPAPVMPAAQRQPNMPPQSWGMFNLLPTQPTQDSICCSEKRASTPSAADYKGLPACNFSADSLYCCRV